MKSPSLSKVIWSGVLLASAMTSPVEAQPRAAEDDSIPTVDANSHPDMWARLEDPHQRAIVRKQERAAIVQSHDGAQEALRLDAATYDKFIDVLTDYQMAQLEHRHLREADHSLHDDDALLANAQRINRLLDSLRDVLGPEKLDRYQAVRFTLANRPELRELNDRLEPAHKLTAAQKQRLVDVLVEHTLQELDHQHAWKIAHPIAPNRPEPLSPEQLRESQRVIIAHNEESWRRTVKVDQELREQVAKFLTAPQLATLARIHAERANEHRQRIERMRVEAGLSPAIPNEPEGAAAGPVKVPGKVTLSLRAVVNRNPPQYITQTVSSGEPITFQLEDGVLLQATATVFDNDMYDLQLAYFEKGQSGPRWIGGMASSGAVTRDPIGNASRQLGEGNGSVAAGNKAYAIWISSRVGAT